MKWCLFLLCLLLAGCSSLNKEECQSKNWYEFGKEDANSGVLSPRNESYKKDCSEFGLSIDEAKYKKGFESGLEKYCTYFTGLQRGQSGESEHTLCEKKNPEFKVGYLAGLEEYKKQKSIKELRAKIIESHGGKECYSPNDCIFEKQCLGGKCLQSNVSCVNSFDCQFKGFCNPYVQFTEYNDHVHVNVCQEKPFYHQFDLKQSL